RDAAAAAEDVSDDGDAPPPPKRRRGHKKIKKMSPLERRDLRYLLEYIVTEGCRRDPWDKFFGNREKKQLEIPVPDGPCCDNCHPDQFQIENIALVGGHSLRTGRKEKSSPELESAVRDRLKVVCDKMTAERYRNQHFITGVAILADDIIETLAKRARLITSVDTLLQQTRWGLAAEYYVPVVEAIKAVTLRFPDHAKAAREQEAAERTQRTLDAAAAKDLRERLKVVFDGCYEAV
ncbi:hypothetical protein DFH06DRAFT_949171, partial [Mycena polygramma]